MSNRFLGLGTGKDGYIDLNTYTQTWYGCSASAGSNSVSVTGTFTAGDRIFIHQTWGGTNPGKYEEGTVASYTSGTVTLVSPLEFVYETSSTAKAQIAVMKEAISVTGSFTPSAWDGATGGIFAMACNGYFYGTVNITGRGFRGGRYWDGLGISATPKTGGSAESYINSLHQYGCGSGPGTGGGISPDPGTSTTTAMPGRGSRGVDQSSSGAGGAYALAGGNGIFPTTPSAPYWSPATGPVAYGIADLTSAFFGGAGAEGGSGNDDFSIGGGNGGNSGGFAYVVCKNFPPSASIFVNGQNGETHPYNPGQCSGGGGGAGGSILIRAVQADINPSLVTANGGIGGLGTGNYAANGGAGSVGRIRVEACSITGSTTPNASTSIGGFSYCGSGFLNAIF